MSPASPPEPHATARDRDRRRYDVVTTLTTLRLRTQLLQRLARTQEVDGWVRMAAGLAAIDADLSKLLRHLADHDGAW